MFMINTLFGIGIVFSVGVLADSKIPSYINVCARNDPNLQKCILDNSEVMRPYLTKGIPELKLGGIDPLVIPTIAMDRNNFHAHFNKFVVKNASLYTLKSMNIQFDDVALDLVIEIPAIKLAADYKLEGSILILQLKGQGTAEADIDNVNVSFNARGVKEVRNDKIYYDFNQTTIDLNVGKVKFLFNNLFGKNQLLTDATNKVINENWKDFFIELMPVAKEVVNALVLPVVQRIFTTFSIDELFPETL